jgi:hypothetical protein
VNYSERRARRWQIEIELHALVILDESRVRFLRLAVIDYIDRYIQRLAAIVEELDGSGVLLIL